MTTRTYKNSHLLSGTMMWLEVLSTTVSLRIFTLENIWFSVISHPHLDFRIWATAGAKHHHQRRSLLYEVRPEMATRPTVSIAGADGKPLGDTCPLPKVFTAPIRPDIVQSVLPLFEGPQANLTQE